jgi:hypothetical protein
VSIEVSPNGNRLAPGAAIFPFRNQRGATNLIPRGYLKVSAERNAAIARVPNIVRTE